MKVIHSSRITALEEAGRKATHDSIMGLGKNPPLTEKEKREKEIINWVINNTKSF